MNILHAWTVNSVNRLVKNPEHTIAITFSSKPNIYLSASLGSSLACESAVSNYFGILDYLLVMQMGKYQVEMTIPFLQCVLECHPVADSRRGAFADFELVLV